jgi:1,2-diacylglycerol-3-alpha-glucose alpha-1,2-galactosyltransferase
MKTPRLKINVLSESEYGGRGQGVHTAFVDTVEMLRRRGDVEVLVNSRKPCDVLHAHTFGPLYWSLMGRYRYRRLMSAHVVPASMEGSILGWQYWGRLFARYIVAAYNSASVVIAVAPAVRRTLKDIGVKSRQVVITNPVNLSKFKPSPALKARGRRLLGLKPGDRVALCVGQIQPRKGVEDFILAARANPGVQFVWAGGRPFSVLTESYAAMNKLMKKAPHNVHFKGMFDLDQMPEIYNAADLFYFPSFQENCALAIAEAAACGLPLLLRDLADYHELYGPNFLAAADSRGFALRVEEFFAKPALRARYRRKSLTMVKRFDVKILCEKLVETYHQLARRDERRQRLLQHLRTHALRQPRKK